MKVVQGGNGPTRSNPGLDTNQMQVKVNMNDTEDLACESCGRWEWRPRQGCWRWEGQ